MKLLAISKPEVLQPDFSSHLQAGGIAAISWGLSVATPPVWITRVFASRQGCQQWTASVARRAASTTGHGEIRDGSWDGLWIGMSMVAVMTPQIEDVVEIVREH